MFIVSSGMTFTLLDGENTAHSGFKLLIPLNYTEASLCNISKQSDAVHVLGSES